MVMGSDNSSGFVRHRKSVITIGVGLICEQLPNVEYAIQVLDHHITCDNRSVSYRHFLLCGSDQLFLPKPNCGSHLITYNYFGGFGGDICAMD